MPPGQRVGAGTGRTSSIRPPQPPGGGRVSALRATRNASHCAASPAESMMGAAVGTSAVGSKRKERDFDADGGGAGSGPSPGVEDTNINVVVRCRGRNEREVRENSAVVVRTDGVKGEYVELSMGPNAVTNKSYSFDRVFSPAADQSMIFDNVVKPILDEMLAGYNCTIFAYGQTGTGKTYTMSGDMTETMGLLSDAAGIIPRVLHALFNRLQADDADNCVKCSFIELYNEELRDLISVEETAKLKIYDDTTAAARRAGHATTVVQGMEEKHIKTAADGIRILQDGSVKRKVAATKCNDLSSRSHTIFTVTASHVRRRADGGEDFVTTGKLNLVDLAGSENIQRSGAENKRAAEAGLINKSLLTLGRVINALIDRSQHVPYRESKLTRLLQDSLGGRTKTCIIATVSLAKVNLEETISTLDYAFRAKNIRNKPQVNLLFNKHILLQDFTAEIERLKSELIATRQRNGVYLSNEAYEEMSGDRESRRIVMEEQAAKIETLEANLRNKVHELFELTSTFVGLRRDHEGTRALLGETKGVLEQTEVVLGATRTSLDQEAMLRRAHEETERKLAEIGGRLIGKLQRTVRDVGGLHAKNTRRADLHAQNRDMWAQAQDHVADVATLVEQRVRDMQQSQHESLASVGQRMDMFVAEELSQLATTRSFLDEQLDRFTGSRRLLVEQQDRSKGEMDNVLEEIKDVRDAVKQRVGASLQAIAAAAERMAGDVVADMSSLHNQLHASYSSLGKDFKGMFEDLMKHVAAQRAESESLRQQLEAATGAVAEHNAALAHRLQQAVLDEKRAAAEDRQKLMAAVAELVAAQAETQQARMAARGDDLQRAVLEANSMVEDAVHEYGVGMDAWNGKEDELLEDVRQGRDRLKTKLKDDWTMANTTSTTIQEATKSVHADTVRIVDEQVHDLDVQMQDLDDFVTRARSENTHHHSVHLDAVSAISSAVAKSFDNISTHFGATFDRVKEFGADMELDVVTAREMLDAEETSCLEPLANLREGIKERGMVEYVPTGETPRKAEYVFPTELPRTGAHSALLAEMEDHNSTMTPTSPTKATSTLTSTAIFTDLPPFPSSLSSLSSSSDRTSSISAPTMPTTTTTGLRELNPNLSSSASSALHLLSSAASTTTTTTTTASIFDPSASTASAASMPPPELKRSVRSGTAPATSGGGTATGTGTGSGVGAGVPGAVAGVAGGGGKNVRKMVAGVENLPPGYAGGNKRKSPRLN